MTAPPSRPEARSRFGPQSASELGAPVASSIPEQLPGREPASARKGYEDGKALVWRYRCVEGSFGRHDLARGAMLFGAERRSRLGRSGRAAERLLDRGGAAPRSEFALQRQPSVRQAALEQLPTPMPFTTRSFRASASGSRTANNGAHQLSLRVRKIMKNPMTRARAYISQNTSLLHLILP